MPGRFLMLIARLVFDESVVMTVVQQTVADLQAEWYSATSVADRLRARWRGYLAFWSLVAISPAAFNGWPGQKVNRRAFWQVTGLVMTTAAVIVWWRISVAELLAPILESLPEGTMAQLGRAGTFAFLAGPIALVLVIAVGRLRGRGSFSTSVPAITFFSLLSIPVGALLGTAGIIGAFEGIGRSGSAGLGSVAQIVTSATTPMFYALVAAVAALLVSAVVAIRSKRSADPAQQPPISRWRAIAVSLVLILSLVGADLLLRQQHELLSWFLALLEPSGSRGVSSLVLMENLEAVTALVLFGSAALTIAFMAAGLVTWRGFRTGGLDPMVKWTTRVALIVAIAGASWHATVIRSDIEAFRNVFAQATAQGRPMR